MASWDDNWSRSAARYMSTARSGRPKPLAIGEDGHVGLPTRHPVVGAQLSDGGLPLPATVCRQANSLANRRDARREPSGDKRVGEGGLGIRVDQLHQPPPAARRPVQPPHGQVQRS